VVYSSKPLISNGEVIDNFVLTFKNGKIIEFSAEKGYEELKRIIELDEGSSYLGEVALVDYDSPISKTGLVFNENLYDENAACHLALGSSYTYTVKNAKGKSKEELMEMGVNQSMEHIDFMIGTKDLTITGTLENGEELVIFENGDYAL